jgi:hypothetical protein
MKLKLHNCVIVPALPVENEGKAFRTRKQITYDEVCANFITDEVLEEFRAELDPPCPPSLQPFLQDSNFQFPSWRKEGNLIIVTCFWDGNLFIKTKHPDLIIHGESPAFSRKVNQMLHSQWYQEECLMKVGIGRDAANAKIERWYAEEIKRVNQANEEKEKLMACVIQERQKWCEIILPLAIKKQDFPDYFNRTRTFKSGTNSSPFGTFYPRNAGGKFFWVIFN